jgi:hypothetical protein
VTWRADGDKRYLDSVNADNRNHASNALQISTAEISTAWKTRTVPEYGNYRAWDEALTLDSTGKNQELAPLFRLYGTRRSSLGNRRAWSFTNFYTYKPPLSSESPLEGCGIILSRLIPKLRVEILVASLGHDLLDRIP